MKNILVIGLIFLYGIKPHIVSAQNYDPMIDTLLALGYNDSSDLNDFYIVDSNVNTNTTMAEPGGGNDHKRCRWHEYCQASQDINLVPNYPYIEVYKDDFNSLDRNMWLSRGFFAGTSQYHRYVQDGCGKHSNSNQAFYQDENVTTSNGNLIITTKEENKVVNWDGCRFEPYPNSSTTQETFKYTSSRVQSKWGFDGNFGFADCDQTDDEGGIVIKARMKFPSANGCFPAYWLMGYFVGSYDEFDIFEFFDNNFNELNASHYNNGATVHDFRCSESYNSPNLKYEFVTYWFLWNRQFIGLWAKRDNGALELIFMRHQIARNNRIGFFQNSISNGEHFRKRMLYLQDPLKINFETHVYPESKGLPFDANLSAQFEVDYVQVFKQMPCPSDVETIYTSPSQFHIRHEVYNVVTAKKAIIDFPASGNYDIQSNQFVKLICQERVQINDLNVSSDGEWVVDHNSDVCHSQYGNTAPPIIYPVETNIDTNGNQQLNSLNIIKDLHTSAQIESNAVNSIYKIIICDLTGREIKSFLYTEFVDKNTKHLDVVSGIYILKYLNMSGFLFNTKLIYVDPN